MESVAYLIKFDSVHGTWGPEVTVAGSNITITAGDRTLVVPYTAIRKPEQVPLHNALPCRSFLLVLYALQRTAF